MDTSEQYIKMCKKAVEIQKTRPMTNSLLPDLFLVTKYVRRCPECEPDGYVDWMYCPEHGVATIESQWEEVVAGVYGPLTKAIWLPRQDQLQDMVSIPLSSLLYDFQVFIRDIAIEGNFSNSLQWSNSGLPS